GESGEGAPASAGGSLLDFHGPDRSFRLVVRPGNREVGGVSQDHVLVAVEPADQGAGLGGDFAWAGEVVGSALGQGAEVVVHQGGQGVGVQVVGSLFTGFAGGVVGAGQGVGHRDGPQLSLRVGVGDRP